MLGSVGEGLKQMEQAVAEPGQAQPMLGLDFTLILYFIESINKLKLLVNNFGSLKIRIAI